MLGLAPGQEAAITGTKPELRLPGNLPDAFRQTLLAQEQWPGDPGSQAVGPGGFYQDPAGVAVASFGDPASAHRGAAGVFRGYQTKIGHEFLGIVETTEVSHFCDYRGRRDELDTPQGLVGGDEGRPAPVGYELPDLAGEALYPGAGLPHCVQVFLEYDLLGRMLHDLL